MSSMYREIQVGLAETFLPLFCITAKEMLGRRGQVRGLRSSPHILTLAPLLQEETNKSTSLGSTATPGQSTDWDGARPKF